MILLPIIRINQSKPSGYIPEGFTLFSITTGHSDQRTAVPEAKNSKLLPEQIPSTYTGYTIFITIFGEYVKDNLDR